MIEDIKLITETPSGTLLRVPAKVQYDDDRIFFLESPFALKDEIKAMRGSKWHGYDRDNPRKIWSIEDCQRNRFQLAYMQGDNPYEWFDREIVKHSYDRPLMTHQKEMADCGLTYHFQIWAAEMGCIDGDATVHVNRAGRGFSLTLRELCYKHLGGRDTGHSWDTSIPTFIRGYKGGHLGLIRVLDVLFKGVQNVCCLKLQSGKTLRLTPDHEVCVGGFRYGQFKPVSNLQEGDVVLCSAPVGFRPQSTVVEQTPPTSIAKTTRLGGGAWLDKDGYIRIGGMKGHSRWSTHGVYEHLLVVEEHIGRAVRKGEEVHHRNGQRWDNRIDNLLLCGSRKEHMDEHRCVENLRRGALVESTCVTFDTVVSVSDAGTTDVYDVVCEGPYHNFVANGVVVHNCGKTLSAIEVIEQSGVKDWIWGGPKASLAGIKREFKKWGLDSSVHVEMMTYEALARLMDEWPADKPPPCGFIGDESSRLKNATSQRSRAAQKLADLIRFHFGHDGYAILMSGTPSPKSPVDWWSQTEIAYPGFLREGSPKALEQRLAFLTKQEFDAGVFSKRLGWKDDERKCDQCGEFSDAACHSMEAVSDGVIDISEYHDYVASKNEVAFMFERLKGLVLVKHKKDCLDLPDKQYRKIICKPSSSVLRVAKAITASSFNGAGGFTLLRELSDGFQYREVKDGVTTCTHCHGEKEVNEWFDPDDADRVFKAIDMLNEETVAKLVKRRVECPQCKGKGEVDKMIRVTKEVPCPKDKALTNLLEENEEQGRIVIFAGFTGSVDRCVNLCLKNEWDVVRCDGRGFTVFKVQSDGSVEQLPRQDALDYWADRENARVAFVAHPESGGMGLTLVEARMVVFYSNSFKPEYRVQSEDRIHRPGMDENLGATIVDLCHLPTDERTLDIIRENRSLELMTMGQFMSGVSWESGNDTEDDMEVVA